MYVYHIYLCVYAYVYMCGVYIYIYIYDIRTGFVGIIYNAETGSGDSKPKPEDRSWQADLLRMSETPACLKTALLCLPTCTNTVHAQTLKSLQVHG